MLPIVIGITYGGVVGLAGNLILFRTLQRDPPAAGLPGRSLIRIFLIRYLLDLIAIITYWFVFENLAGLVAVGLSIVVAVRVSLFVVHRKKGGRL